MSAPKDSARFPIKTKQVCLEINGNSTDIICRDYEDQVFIIVTQFQKIGTLVQISKDTLVAEDNQGTYSTKTLLGKDEPIIHVIARNIALAVSTQKPILLGLALKDLSRPTTKRIEELIVENKVWE